LLEKFEKHKKCTWDHYPMVPHTLGNVKDNPPKPNVSMPPALSTLLYCWTAVPLVLLGLRYFLALRKERLPLLFELLNTSIMVYLHQFF
jgi:hypothetical protein